MADTLPAELAESLQAVRSRLAPLAWHVIYFRTIGSTNDAAAAAATADQEGLVVVADEQTAGRGRSGNSWHSPAGAGLYMSVVLAPARARVETQRARLLLTIAAGVGIAEGIGRATGLVPAIKWPNDLLIGSRKVCGILAEAPDAVVLGYGINISPAAYPPDIAERATSLEAELGRPVERGLVFAETLAGLAARYRELLDGRFDAILDSWRRLASIRPGVQITWNMPGGPRVGTAVGIDDDGALIVRVGDAIERLTAGEISELRG